MMRLQAPFICEVTDFKDTEASKIGINRFWRVLNIRSNWKTWVSVTKWDTLASLKAQDSDFRMRSCVAARIYLPLRRTKTGKLLPKQDKKTGLLITDARIG